MKKKMQLFLKKSKSLPALYYDMTFVEAIYPVLFSARDFEDNVYICACHCCNGLKREWIIVPTSYQNLIELLTDCISIRDIFTEKNAHVFIATQYADTDIKVEEVKTEDVDPSILPTANCYMEAEPDEFAEEITELESRLHKEFIFGNETLKQCFSMALYILHPSPIIGKKTGFNIMPIDNMNMVLRC